MEGAPADEHLQTPWEDREDEHISATAAPLETLDDGQLLSLVMTGPAGGRSLRAVGLLRDSEGLSACWRSVSNRS